MPTEFPGIYRAALKIALDNGGINRTRSVERHRKDFERWIANQPHEMLPAIDKWLDELPEEDIEFVCCASDEPEGRALLKLSPPFTDDLLTTYFEEVC